MEVNALAEAVWLLYNAGTVSRSEGNENTCCGTCSDASCVLTKGYNMQLSVFKKTLLATTVVAAASFSHAAELNSDESIASYGIGYGYVLNLLEQTQGLNLDSAAFVQGALDAFQGNDVSVTDAQVSAAIEALQAKQMAAMEAIQAEQAVAAKQAGEAFLAENAKKAGVTVTESGLQYEVIEKSGGTQRPTANSNVKVHYHGTLVNGTVFDSSVERGQPIDFNLSGVIAGWTEGVQLMAKGDRYRFYIPANLAYGDRSPSPVIPAGSTLIFDVELLDIL